MADTVAASGGGSSLQGPGSEPGLAKEGPRFAPFLVNAGFVFALVLTAVCLLSSIYYLYSFLTTSTHRVEYLLLRAGAPGVTEVLLQLGINAALVSARLALLSCGVFVGMSFGFLGFALFLLGIKGEVEASGQLESMGVKFARISPGALIIICGMILVAVCVTHRTPFDYRSEQPAAKASQPPAGPLRTEKVADTILKQLADRPTSASVTPPASESAPAATPHVTPDTVQTTPPGTSVPPRQALAPGGK